MIEIAGDVRLCRNQAREDAVELAGLGFGELRQRANPAGFEVSKHEFVAKLDARAVLAAWLAALA